MLATGTMGTMYAIGTYAGLQMGRMSGTRLGAFACMQAGGYLGLLAGQYLVSKGKLKMSEKSEKIFKIVKASLLTSAFACVAIANSRGAWAKDCMTNSGLHCRANKIVRWTSLSGVSCSSALLLFQACKLYLCREQRLWQWSYEDQKVVLVRRFRQLSAVVFNTEGKKVDETNINTGGANLNETIEKIKQMILYKKEDGSFHFSKPFYKKSVKDWDVSLIRVGSKLVWSLVNQTTQKVSCLPFLSMTINLREEEPFYVNRKCELAEIFFKLQDKSRDGNDPVDLVESFGDQFEVNKIIESASSRLTVEVSGRIIPSRIDIAEHVTKDNWLVTLICRDGTGILSGNHAQIVIEGVDGNGKYFMKTSHLYIKKKTGKPKIKTNRISRCDYNGRSDVWRVSSLKVREMVKAIKEDKKNPPQLFAGGSRSIFASPGEESCFTWAKAKLEMLGIRLEKKSIEGLVSITSAYTKSDEVIKMLRRMQIRYPDASSDELERRTWAAFKDEEWKRFKKNPLGNIANGFLETCRDLVTAF